MSSRRNKIIILIIALACCIAIGVPIAIIYPTINVAIGLISSIASIISLLPLINSWLFEKKALRNNSQTSSARTPKPSSALPGTRIQSIHRHKLLPKVIWPLVIVCLTLIGVVLSSLLPPQDQGLLRTPLLNTTATVPTPIPIYDVAWSLDGKRIAFASGDNTVQVWDVTTRQRIHTYTGVGTVAWSPDGQRFVSIGGDGTVQVWDIATGNHVVTHTGYKNTVAIAWSPDGMRIASASYDDIIVQVWDVVDGATVYAYRGHSKPVQAVAWSPDSKRIARSDARDTVQVWVATTGGHVITHPGCQDSDLCPSVPISLAWSPDGKLIASSNGFEGVSVWDAATGGKIVNLTYSTHVVVRTLAWSPDGRYIALGIGNTAQVWDAAHFGSVVTYTGHTGDVNAVEWSPDGTRIASASDDGTVQVWDALSGHSFFKLPR